MQMLHNPTKERKCSSASLLNVDYNPHESSRAPFARTTVARAGFVEKPKIAESPGCERLIQESC